MSPETESDTSANRMSLINVAESASHALETMCSTWMQQSPKSAAKYEIQKTRNGHIANFHERR